MKATLRSVPAATTNTTRATGTADKRLGEKLDKLREEETRREDGIERREEEIENREEILERRIETDAKAELFTFGLGVGEANAARDDQKRSDKKLKGVEARVAAMEQQKRVESEAAVENPAAERQRLEEAA